MRLLQTFLDEDRAVSPVIGVILMVAITVILAAVIASFVLGLGDSADQVQPNTSFTFDYDNVTGTGDGEGNVTVTLSDGEPLANNEVYLRGEQLNSSGQLSSISHISVNSGQWDAGESIEIDVDDNDYVLNIVWESEDSDDSSRLQTDRGPNA